MGGHLSHARGNCEALLADLFGYLDGELSAARCKKIERHLDACPCCGYLAVRLRRAIAVCRAAGRSTLPAGVRREARARIADLLGTSPMTGGESPASPKSRRQPGSRRRR